jgi:hypothetical protein
VTGPILCPHCEEVTLPNRLVDGTVICSCAAGRRLDGGGAAADREDDPPHRSAPVGAQAPGRTLTRRRHGARLGPR